MMTRGMVSLVACLASACGAVADARAESFKDKGGIVVFVPTSMESAKQTDGSLILKITSIGISVADLPFPYDYMKSHCTGTVLLAADGKLVRARGMCEVLSSKGDRAAYIYAGDASGGRTTWVEGAGRYAGIKGGSTYKPKATMPDGGVVYEWNGTWQTD